MHVNEGQNTSSQREGRRRAFGFATPCLDHYTMVVITNPFYSLFYLNVSDEKG